MGAGQQVITLWFISAADPRAVLTAEPQADRGYARKLLAQLNPAWPLTHIGDFDMNRSVPPGDGEFYIGGYRGLTVIQTVLPKVPADWSLSAVHTLPAPFDELTSMIPAADLLVTVHTPDDHDGLGGFSHWVGGRMTRCFYANRKWIIEDTGLPLPDEATFWDGDTTAPEAHGIELPFRPSEMAAAAIAHWLGFQVSDEIDIPVAAFAIDGRPEVRNSHADREGTTDRPETTPSSGVTANPVGVADATGGSGGSGGASDPGDAGDASTAKAAGGPGAVNTTEPLVDRGGVHASDADYDDYSDQPNTASETRSTAELLRGAAGSVIHGLGTGARWLRAGTHRIGDEVRRRARNTGR